MTKAKKLRIQYFELSDIKIIHSIISEKFREAGEPIPLFELAKKDKLDALVNGPKHSFVGFDAYPTLYEKAAIIFYSINKDQIFVNGNKRMSTACLVIFLAINNKDLNVNPDELTQKALEISQTNAEDFQRIKVGLVNWIQENTIDMEQSEE
jgi:death-on-curing protein